MALVYPGKSIVAVGDYKILMGILKESLKRKIFYLSRSFDSVGKQELYFPQGVPSLPS